MCDISISLTSSQAFTPLLCGHVCTVISSFHPWKVAFEYIACHNHYNDQSSIGCVILSELSGASQGLGAGALLVNPYDVPSVALTLHEALTWEEEAPEEVEEYRKMWSYLCEFVKNNTAALWAHNFISEMRNLDALEEDSSEEDLYDEPEKVPVNTIAALYSQSTGGRRLIILGCVGTLIDHADFTQMQEIPSHVITLTLTPTLTAGDPLPCHHLDPGPPRR